MTACVTGPHTLKALTSPHGRPLLRANLPAEFLPGMSVPDCGRAATHFLEPVL